MNHHSHTVVSTFHSTRDCRPMRIIVCPCTDVTWNYRISSAATWKLYKTVRPCFLGTEISYKCWSLVVTNATLPYVDIFHCFLPDFCTSVQSSCICAVADWHSHTHTAANSAVETNVKIWFFSFKKNNKIVVPQGFCKNSTKLPVQRTVGVSEMLQCSQLSNYIQKVVLQKIDNEKSRLFLHICPKI